MEGTKLKKILVLAIGIVITLILFPTSGEAHAKETNPEVEINKIHEKTNIPIEELKKRWNQYEKDKNHNKLFKSERGNVHHGDIMISYTTTSDRVTWWNQDREASAVTRATSFSNGGPIYLDKISAKVKVYKKIRNGFTVSEQATDTNTNFNLASVALVNVKSSSDAFTLGIYKWEDSSFGNLGWTTRINH